MACSIEVDQVSKRFRLARQRATTLREKLTNGLRPGGANTDFWALKNVSFAVEPGSALGIVGHNGSGKSTMLKLLTGIMKPTHGSVHTRGRVAALIEVGAGFHPDLSGRENIYLNGSILGLSRREIASKFDRIVDFAGLESFIDTPVKRYSTGMFMRLGFSIAAHIDPDILLIDEVLAVGDAQFQNKCLRIMKAFIAQGGTVVFVSHSMALVAELCPRCVWLDHGELCYFGDTQEAADRYEALVAVREDEEFKRHFPEEWAIQDAERREAEAEAKRVAQVLEQERLRREEERRQAEEEAKQREAQRRLDPLCSRITRVLMSDAEGNLRTHFGAGEAARIEIGYRLARPVPNPIFGVDIYRTDGLHMFTTSNFDHQLRFDHLPAEGTVTLDIPFLSVNEAAYRIRLSLFADSSLPDWWEHPEDVLEEALVFQITAGRFAHGCTFVPTRWNVPVQSPVLADPASEDRVLLSGRTLPSSNGRL